MYEREVKHILVDILCTAVNGVENNDSIKQRISPESLASVYHLAKKHDMAHVVSRFVYQNNIETDQRLMENLRQEEFLSVYRDEQMKYAFGEICEAFDAVNIEYVPLKGSVLRPYYPYESMRTSCDIDILIQKTDLDAAIKCLEEKGYSCNKRNFHDVSLYSPSKVHLELHFSLQEKMENLDEVLKDAWKYVKPAKGSQCEFSDDFFAFHIFSHMVYHFVSGGCGIRSLLDIWIMKHKMGITYTCAEELLEKAGILKFSKEMSELAEKCFSGDARDSFSDLVLSYIFDGGVYGSSENHIAIDKSKSKGSFVYAIKRLFPSYKYMSATYPSLKKVPFLLPLYWVARWIKALCDGKTKRVASEMSYAGNVSDERIREVNQIRSRLGL